MLEGKAQLMPLILTLTGEEGTCCWVGEESDLYHKHCEAPYLKDFIFLYVAQDNGD